METEAGDGTQSLPGPEPVTAELKPGPGFPGLLFQPASRSQTLWTARCQWVEMGHWAEGAGQAPASAPGTSKGQAHNNGLGLVYVLENSTAGGRVSIPLISGDKDKMTCFGSQGEVGLCLWGRPYSLKAHSIEPCRRGPPPPLWGSWTSGRAPKCRGSNWDTPPTDQ